MTAEERRLRIDIVVPLYNEEIIVAEFHRHAGRFGRNRVGIDASYRGGHRHFAYFHRRFVSAPRQEDDKEQRALHRPAAMIDRGVTQSALTSFSCSTC